MTKQEIKKAIENGESVWFSYNNSLFELCKDSTARIVFKDFTSFLIGNYKINRNGISIKVDDNNFNREYFYDTEINNFYKTKAEAEHYLHHANISRTETLPFVTWEEFKSGKNITFKAKNGHEFLLKAKQESIYLWWLDTNNIWKTWDLTEENFYKAYDECVRLFKGDV